MAYKFNPCTTCPCETTPSECPTLTADLAWHLNIFAGMHAFVLNVTTNAGCFVPSGSYLMVSDGGLNFRRVGAPILNIHMTLSGVTTVPNAAFPYEQLRRIDGLTFTSGGDVLTYAYDDATGKLKRDDDLTTELGCCVNSLSVTTWFTPRIFNDAHLPGTAQPKSVRITLAGFGGSPVCAAFNAAVVTNQFPAASEIAEGYWTPSTGTWQRSLLPPTGTFNDFVRLYTFVNNTNRWSTHFTRGPVPGVVPFAGWASLSNPVMAAVYRQGTGPTTRGPFRMNGNVSANMFNPFDASLFVYDAVAAGALACVPFGNLTAIDEL